MKTSIKIVLLAVLLLTSGIAWYGYQMKRLFDTGSYLVPYLHYTDMRLSGFRHIRNESSSDINLKIVPGPFKVLLEPSAVPYTKVKVINDTLIIAAEYTGGYRGNSDAYVMYLFCPSVSSLSCNSTSIVDGQRKTDTVVNEYFDRRHTLIAGFELDSLSISENYASDVQLRNNRVNVFRADVGIDAGSGSRLAFADSNRIGRAQLNIRNKSRLLLRDAFGGEELNYTLDDNARMIVYGRAERHLQKADFKKLTNEPRH